MLAKLEERLKRITEYKAKEWAQRLDEVGGPGVGGTELAYSPHFVQSAETQNELVAMALETSIPETWEEASWCYVFGEFRACIVMSATLLEIALKYELYRKGAQGVGTLGQVIQKCSNEGILPATLRSLALSINQRRNDIMHAKIQRDRPESLIMHTGDEHEEELITDHSRIVTQDGWITGNGETIAVSFGGEQPKYSRILAFKKAAKANLLEVREILKYLYAPAVNQPV